MRFSSNGLTVAAAVGLVSFLHVATAAAQTIIVDNVDAGFSVLSGTWSTGTMALGHWGADYRFRSTTMSGATAGEVQWQPVLTVAGDYEVAIYYPEGTNRANNAAFVVHHLGGPSLVVVDQTDGGETWFVLGTFSFSAGTSGRVTLNNSANAGVFIADAVRFAAGCDPCPPGPTFADAGAAVLGGLSVDARSGSFADIDNDGDVDLLIQGAVAARKLLRNNIVGTGAATFTDISSTLHPLQSDTTWSACWGDYDSDGDVDVFIGSTNLGSNTGDLLRNDGAAGFTDAGAITNLDDPGFHQNVAWCDIDNDLDLDLLLAMEGPTQKHEIYLQGPTGQFTPVGAAVGFQQLEGVKAYGMAIGDTDDDGDIDVYISTCRADNNIRNNFYENRLAQTGSLAFVDIADTNGTQFMTNSYGAEFHDMDDDGDLDLIMVGADGQPSKIFRNNGGNQFTDVDLITGHALLSDVGGDLNGGRAVDYDNDGDLDLYFHDHLVRAGIDNARKLFRNDGNWVFTDVTAAEGLQASCKGGYDSAWADFDLDGDQDLFFPTGTGVPERFFVSSASTNGNHWLYVRLRGDAPNMSAVGARIDATLHYGLPQQRTLRRDANANAGTFNQSDTPVHMGLGAADRVDVLRIVWPDGGEQVHCDVAGDRYVSFAVAPAGDFTGDGDVNLVDYDAFEDCLAGPGAAPSPTSAACASACLSAFDADDDGDVDARDFAALQRGIGAP